MEFFWRFDAKEMFRQETPHLPGVKTAVRRYTIAETQEIARAALALDSAEAVQTYLQKL